MKKNIRILLGVVIAIVGVILTFLGIFSLGPLPLPAFSTGVYWAIIAGVSGIICGLTFLFPLSNKLIYFTSTLLIILNIIALISEFMLNYHPFSILYIAEILLGLLQSSTSFIENRQ